MCCTKRHIRKTSAAMRSRLAALQKHPGLFLKLLALHCVLTNVRACWDCTGADTPSVTLEVITPTETFSWFAKPAAFGPCPTEEGDLIASFPIVSAQPRLLCNDTSQESAVVTKAKGSAMFAERGNCTFIQKARDAAILGASLLILADNVEKPLFQPYCDGANGDCNSTLVTVIISTEDGKQLESVVSMNDPVIARVFWRPRSAFDPSSVLIWLLAVCTALIGVWWSADVERKLVYIKLVAGLGGRGGNAEATQRLATRQEEENQQNLTPAHALGFVLCGSVVLVVLFFFMRYLIVFVYIMFALASANALNFVGTPLAKLLVPALRKQVAVPYWGPVSIASLGLLPVCFATVLLWYFMRLAWWVWPLQNAMAICISIFFLSTIRIPNVKVAAVLFTVALLYDVFWVYLSPFLFRGQSVMVAVATGSGVQSDGGDQVNDNAMCGGHTKGVTTAIPMLLVMPRISDWAGGASLLGLGDIVLPSLITSLALRFDYWLLLQRGNLLPPPPRWMPSQGRGAQSLHHLYWLPQLRYFGLMALGYAVGLALANVFVYIVGPQPALLYLCPCTLLPLLTMARQNGHLKALWEGPSFEEHLHPQSNGGTGEFELVDRQEDVETGDHSESSHPPAVSTDAAVMPPREADDQRLLESEDP